jgi:cytochrome c peroxidase
MARAARDGGSGSRDDGGRALGNAAVAVALAAALLAGCGGGGSTNGTAGLPKDVPLSAQAELGRKIFADPSLSASGRLACASCHDPASGHAPANALAVQLGGPLLDQQGTRKAPAIRYLAFSGSFFFDGEGTPTGGFFWDGRAASLQDQAAQPLLAPNEMANTDAADAVARLARAAYADEFRRVYGADIFDRPDAAFAALTLSVQAYEREDIDFRPFTSKYDEFLRGNVRLTDQEMRGLALYNAPGKGNCQACHPSARGADGSFPLFTDFTYDNLGVPRNPEIAANADPAHFDLGLCARPDLAGRADLCGAFKVPSLRNVGLRQAYFHNGRFKTLKDAVTFYVQRDTNPEKWYPLDANGQPKKFDDLPPEYHGNVNTTEVPYNRRLGDAPALTDAEVDDVVAFLRTLSDGWLP